MKRALFKFFVNIIFSIFIVVIAITITTISLTKKINDFNKQYQQGVGSTVVKDEIPVIGMTKGIIKTLNVSEGQQVKKGQLLAEITNPVLEAQIRVFASDPKNESAQTQAKLAKADLAYDTIYAPVDGIISNMQVTVNSPIDQYSRLMSIYANQNTKVLVYFTTDQYLTSQKMAKIPAFDPRLNQDFYLAVYGLKPNQEILAKEDNPSVHKVAVYLKLLNSQDSLSLLNGEQLQLKLTPPEDQTNKPINIFVRFWDSLIK